MGLGSLDQGCSVKEKGEGEKPLPLPTALHRRGKGLLEAMCVQGEVIGNMAELNQVNPRSGLVAHAAVAPHITADIRFPASLWHQHHLRNATEKKGKPE